MLDSFFTLTKRGLFWLIVGWLVAVVFDRVVALVTGTPLSFVILAVISIPLYLLVAGVYTLGKKIARRSDSATGDHNRGI